MAIFKRTGKKNKQAPDSGRRRPIERPNRGSFTYYSGNRTNPVLKGQADRPAGRQLDKKTQSTADGSALMSKHLISRLKKQWGTVVLSIVLIVCAFSLLQVDTKPRIIIVGTAHGHNLNSTEAYSQQVTNSLRGSLLNGNKVTINTSAIVMDLLQKFPEIYDASVVLPVVGHRPSVYIELAKPVLLLQTANNVLVIDASGRALQASPNHAKFANLALPTVVDQNNLNLKVGDVVLSSASVSFIRDILRQFAAQHTEVNRMVLPAGKEELDVYPVGATYFVKFNLHLTNSRQQAGTYFATQQELLRKGKGKRLPSEYFDVRLPGRVYYK